MEPAAPPPRDDARLFVALWPDPVTRGRLSASREAWRWPPTARLVADASLHLTLHYIGELARRRLDELKAALATVPTADVTLNLRDGAVWKGGIAVLRAFDPPPRLLALHRRIGATLAELGIALETRPFAPHVTLARRATAAVAPEAPATVEWHASGFVLVESIRGGRGTYQVLRRFDASLE